MTDMNRAIFDLDIHKDHSTINQWIKQYNPFILSTVSAIKNEYIHIENDDTYSIALMAFVEAIDRYDILRGSFLPYCRMVISSRVNSHLKSESKHRHLSIDIPENNLLDKMTSDAYHQRDTCLSDEILLLEKKLKPFNIPFKILASVGPKHSDTKQTLISAAKSIQSDPILMSLLYQKGRLPITKIAEQFLLSIKTLKTYKFYIIAVILIIENDLVGIKEWIQINEKGPQTRKSRRIV